MLVALILLFLSPTIFAVFYAVHVDNVSAASFSVTLYTDDGDVIISEEGNPETASQKSLLGIFYRISTLNEPLAQAPGAPDTDPYIVAECVLNGTESQWRCYFSPLGIDGYCIDSNGAVHPISKTITKYFLSTEYAESFYTSAMPPTLRTVDNDAVLPSYVNWYYQSQGGEFLKATHPKTTEENILYDMTGEIKIDFEHLPDVCTVSVYDEDQELFQGSYTELSTLTVELERVLDVSVQAEWLPTAKYDAYGTAEYRFSIQIHNQAEFSIHTDTVSPGEFLVLSCTNVSDLSKIKFTPLQENVIPTPVFHRDGNYVRALLAFSEDVDAKEFSFTVAYGASQKQFSVAILESTASESFSYPDWNPNDFLLTNSIRNAVSNLLKTLPEYRHTELYFHGRFDDPTEQGFTPAYTHGASVEYGQNADQSFVAFGSAFRSNDSNARVLALHHGVVVKVGVHGALGRFVIVDHGGGLRTWYCHLQSQAVKEGSVVKQGDLLGRTEFGGNGEQTGVLILCTLYNTVLNPSSVIGKEFSLPTT